MIRFSSDAPVTNTPRPVTNTRPHGGAPITRVATRSDEGEARQPSPSDPDAYRAYQRKLMAARRARAKAISAPATL